MKLKVNSNMVALSNDSYPYPNNVNLPYSPMDKTARLPSINSYSLCQVIYFIITDLEDFLAYAVSMPETLAPLFSRLVITNNEKNFFTNFVDAVYWAEGFYWIKRRLKIGGNYLTMMLICFAIIINDSKEHSCVLSSNLSCLYLLL